MNPLIYAAIALVVMPLVQVALFARLTRASRAPIKDEQRVAQLAAALELLTDTAEEGFVNVAAELERLGAKPLAPRSTRRATTRRIAAAVRKGQSVQDIAIAESVSESEVRLHLGLEAGAESAVPVSVDAAADTAPSGVAELEQWMTMLQARRRAKGDAHAVV